MDERQGGEGSDENDPEPPDPGVAKDAEAGIAKKWQSNQWLGNKQGPLTPRGGGYFQAYEKGTILWHKSVGAFQVHGLIGAKYWKLGGPASALGFPRSDEANAAKPGRYNQFVGGTILWTKGSPEAFEVRGAIRSKWAALGFESGFLGFPVTDETSTPDGVGRYNHFEGGSIYWTPDSGAFEVHGLIRKRYAEFGWERSPLGYPISDEKDMPGGKVSQFEGGTIEWTAKGGAHEKVQPPVPKPRPFYLIAHRCNDLEKVADMVAAGANAVECDIQGSSHPGVDFAVNHDLAWKPERDAIRPFLDGVAKIFKNKPQVSLMIFDIKEPEWGKADLLRQIIRKHLTDVVPVNVIISVAKYDGRNFFLPIKGDVRPREGYAIDQDNDPVKVSEFFQSINVANHAYGNGIFVAGGGENVPHSVLFGTSLKWSHRKVRCVYVWTIGQMDSMRKYIGRGVDGIMVNDVPALKEVLGEANIKKQVRLATRADNPMAPSDLPAYVLTVKTGSRTDAGTSALLRFELRGSVGTAVAEIDAGSPGLFGEDCTNRVTLIGTEVGTVRELVLSHDGSGIGDGWFVDTVDVRKSGSSSSLRFDFEQWIRADRPARRTPSNVRYDVRVWTSRDTSGSGTDADVKIMLQGTRGYIEKEFDGNEGDLFENDSSDSLQMYGIDIGTLKSISLTHDGSGAGDEWHVARVFVKGASIDANVPVDRWVKEGTVTTVNL